MHAPLAQHDNLPMFRRVSTWFCLQMPANAGRIVITSGCKTLGNGHHSVTKVSLADVMFSMGFFPVLAFSAVVASVQLGNDVQSRWQATSFWSDLYLVLYATWSQLFRRGSALR